MADLIKNFAYCKLTAAVDAVATSLSVDSVARLPTDAQVQAGDFWMTIDEPLALGGHEVVKVTGITGTTLTVLRGQEGTAGAAHDAGRWLKNALTTDVLGRKVRGALAVAHRGEYSGTYPYKAGEVVIYQGGSYVALTDLVRTTFLDAFDRTGISLGNGWTVRAGDIGTNGTEAYRIATSAFWDSAVATQDLGSAEGTFQLVVGASTVGLFLRSSTGTPAADTLSGVCIRSDGNAYAFGSNAGYTTLGTFAAFVAGDVMEVVISGNNYTVKKNGTTLTTVTSALNATSTHHGIQLSSATATAREFQKVGASVAFTASEWETLATPGAAGPTGPTGPAGSADAVLATVGSGLPSFSGRKEGDRHYDTATGRDYVLTGAAGATATDDYERADGPLQGTTTTTGGKTWVSSLATGSAQIPSIVSGKVKRSAGAGDGWSYFDFGSAVRRVVSADVTISSAADSNSQFLVFAAPNGNLGTNDTGVVHVGKTNIIIGALGVAFWGSYNWPVAKAAGTTVAVAVDYDPTTGAYVVTADDVTVLSGTDPSVATRAAWSFVGLKVVDSDASNVAAFDNFAVAATGTLAWTDTVPVYLQSILAGTLVVGNDVLPPGLRVPKATTARQIVGRVGTAPAGVDLIFTVERFNNGVSQGLVGTVTIPAGSTNASVTGLSAALAGGDILKVNVTQVGSTTAGADLNVSVDCW